MKKATTPSFVITLPLVTKGHDVAVMRKRFEAAKRLYNALLSEGISRLNAMRSDPRWAQLRDVKDLQTMLMVTAAFTGKPHEIHLQNPLDLSMGSLSSSIEDRALAVA